MSKTVRHYIQDHDNPNQGSIDLRGSGAARKDRNEILLTINAPSLDIVIDELTLHDTWLALQVRACKSLTIEGKAHIFDFQNDAAQICCSNVVMDFLQAETELEKAYGPLNHPDILQMFSWIKGAPLHDVTIKRLDAYIRNCRKHGVVHLTENQDYHNIFIGEDGVNVDTDADLYPYWFSATRLSRSVIGHPDADVSGKTVRVRDVKHSGVKAKDNIFVGLPPESLDVDGDYMVT